MKFGICTAVANATAVKAAGWDYVEESVQGLLHAHDQAAGEWVGADLVGGAALPVPAANMMVPADHKVTGPDVNPGKLATYMSIALSRAQRVGINTVVFGSGGARMVPEGFDKAKATDQIVSFLKSVAPVAEDHGVTIVVEHLNKTECNILNGVDECAEVVRRVDHPAVRLLVDTYHVWVDGIDYSEIEKNVSLVRHVHLADKEGRVAPGLSGTSDYVPIFKILKQGGYKGKISVEAMKFDVVSEGPKVLKTVKDAWAAA